MQLLPFLALVTACVAGPIASRAAIRPYVKPKSTDSRSPCPMLNTLANHGYLYGSLTSIALLTRDLN